VCSKLQTISTVEHKAQCPPADDRVRDASRLCCPELLRQSFRGSPEMAALGNLCAESAPRPDSPLAHDPEVPSMLSRFPSCVQTFLADEGGPTAVEYAVMLALIITVCLTAITSVGTNASKTFSTVASKLGSS